MSNLNNGLFFGSKILLYIFFQPSQHHWFQDLFHTMNKTCLIWLAYFTNKNLTISFTILMPQLTAFSFSTWESVLSSPNSAKNAWVDLNLSGSRKLSRLWSSSVLFCRGVPDSRTWCSCNKHLDEFSMKAANLFLSQPFELKVHCLPYNSENSLAKLITVLYKTIK